MASEIIISTHFTGKCEVQECLDGHREIDLQRHLSNCKKNPGHTGFVPVNTLTIEHFPARYHDYDICKFTKALADLTVRVAVKFTSPERPEFIPGTKDPYPCYNTRGQNSLRTGTGRVWKVTKYTEGMWGHRTCPCPECDHSDTPSKVWWLVRVRTATHVVFDLSEARQSCCRLWFDEEKSPVFKVFGWEMAASKTKRDWCEFYCVTHDPNIGGKLKQMKIRFDNLWRKVSDKYNSCNEVDKLTIIVSHPHGCSKQVSVGHWVHRQEIAKIFTITYTRYTYTTCTCPGSSGACVYRLGCGLSNHPHSGVNSDGFNYSGVCME